MQFQRCRLWRLAQFAQHRLHFILLALAHGWTRTAWRQALGTTAVSAAEEVLPGVREHFRRLSEDLFDFRELSRPLLLTSWLWLSMNFVLISALVPRLINLRDC